MKYIIGIIVTGGLILGIYWWNQPRPECGATITTTNQCVEGIIK